MIWFVIACIILISVHAVAAFALFITGILIGRLLFASLTYAVGEGFRW